MFVVGNSHRPGKNGSLRLVVKLRYFGNLILRNSAGQLYVFPSDRVQVLPKRFPVIRVFIDELQVCSAALEEELAYSGEEGDISANAWLHVVARDLRTKKHALYI